MTLSMTVQKDSLEVRNHNLLAHLSSRRVSFATMGCKLLGSITKEVPPGLKTRWDDVFGRGWKSTKDATGCLAEGLNLFMEQSGISGIELWDTMRNGSDYWRPGNLLKQTGEKIRLQRPEVEVSYAREDDLCPPADLLEEARKNPEMPFGKFAQRYANYLRSGNKLDIAAWAVIRALASGKIAVFYCTDPHIPDYGDPSAMLGEVPYEKRQWMRELPAHGCHRVILAEELIRYFRENGVRVDLFEVDQSFGKVHQRSF